MSEHDKDGTEEEFPWDADWDSALSEWEDKAFSDTNFQDEAVRSAKPPTVAQTQESPVFREDPPEPRSVPKPRSPISRDLDSVTQSVALEAPKPPGRGVLGAARPISLPQQEEPRNPEPSGTDFEYLAETRSASDAKELLGGLDARDPIDQLIDQPGSSEDVGDAADIFDADLDAPTRRSAEDLAPLRPALADVDGFLPGGGRQGDPGSALAAQREPFSELVTRQIDRTQGVFANLAPQEPSTGEQDDRDEPAHARALESAPSSEPLTAVSQVPLAPSQPPSSHSARPRSTPPPLPREATPAPAAALRERPRRSPPVDEVPESAPAPRLDSASWMQEEARRRPDPIDGARLLLSASELRAIQGDIDTARELAEQALRFAPTFEPAIRLARQHATRAGDAERELELLRLEAEHASTDAARRHALFVATEHADSADQDEFLRAALQGEDTIRGAVHVAAAHLRESREAPPEVPAHSIVFGALDDACLRLGLRELREGEGGPTAAIRRLRDALSAGDVAAASHAVEGFADDEALTDSALWLAALFASYTEGDSRAPALLEMIPDDARKARFLASLAMERRTPALLAAALTQNGAWSSDERLALLALVAPVANLDRTPTDASPLACAVAGLRGAQPPETLTGRSVAQVRLGRALSQSATHVTRQEIRALAEKAHGTTSPTMVAVEWLLWSADGPRRELAEALSAHAGSDGTLLAAAALLAEFAKDPELAQELYKRVLYSEGPAEAAARCIFPFDSAGAELSQMTERISGLRGAALHLECAIAPGTKPPQVQRHLEAAEDEGTALGVVPALGELYAMESADTDAAAVWRSKQTSDDTFLGPFLLMRQFAATEDPEHLRAASAAAPKDAALRDLLEAKVLLSFEEKAIFRESALDLQGPSAPVHLLEATLLRSDATLGLRAARALADVAPSPLGLVILERLETETGDGARLAEELISTARSTEDAGKRREAYERLAELDGLGRKDDVSALMWHRTILEDTPSHLRSLRYVENALLRDARIDEYLPVAVAVARALAKRDAAEVVAHAYIATRLQLAVDDTLWSQTREMCDLAYAEGDPGPWAIRAHYSHARVAKDERGVLSAAVQLAESSNSTEAQSLLYVRAADAALHLGKAGEAEELLTRATEADPGDFIAWLELAELRDARNATAEAAEAFENLARAFAVDRHALTAWNAAGMRWIASEGMRERAIVAFEHASNIDPTFADVFARLSELYAEEGRAGDLAELLERRLIGAQDDDERAHLEVELGRTLAELGDEDAARNMFRRALDKRPDNAHALALYADLSAKRKDWEAAEQSWVRLARLLPTKEEQRDVYERLGELYTKHAINYARAEVAWREVLKRDDHNENALLRLVDVYRGQDNAAQAIETYEQYVALSEGPAVRLGRLVGLAQLHEVTARNPKKAEALLDAARKEAPASPVILRALAEFYTRQRQGPAVNVLLDRAAGDARRVLAAGRPTRAAFETLSLVAELRGRAGGARVIQAALAALDGAPSAIEGAGVRALDPRLDDLLAPEILSPALRALLAQAGDAFDIASPLDTRRLGATAVTQQYRDVVAQIGRTAQELGLKGLQVGMAARVGRVCLPCASSPPTLVVGEPLLKADDAKVRAFLVVRALKLVAARASALVRVPAQDLAILVAAWLRGLNPSWVAPGVDAAQLAEAGRRLAPGLPRSADPNFGVLALEAAAAIGNQAAQVGNAAVTWANRSALLAVGDPTVALEGLAWSLGQEGVPQDEAGRAAWIAKTADARDLLTFAASDALLEARRRLGLPA